MAENLSMRIISRNGLRCPIQYNLDDLRQEWRRNRRLIWNGCRRKRPRREKNKLRMFRMSLENDSRHTIQIRIMAGTEVFAAAGVMDPHEGDVVQFTE